MTDNVILSVSEVSKIAHFVLHIIIGKILHFVLHIIIGKILHYVQNDSEVCKASLRSRRMTNRGATDPTLTRRRVLNAHSGYRLFRKAVGS